MARFDHYERCPRCDDNGGDRRGDNLAVYDDGGSHCFSCGYHKFPVRHIPRHERAVDVPKSLLPIDFTREVPAVAWQWLLQYGLGWKYWKPFVGWSEKDSRLVFTCGSGKGEGPVAFSIGRYIPVEGRVGPAHPKKWFVYGDSHRRPEVFATEKYDRSASVVLVEDLISAHKVGQVCTAIPLFGTKIFSSLVPCLRHIGLPVIMWLDKDQDMYAPRRAAALATVTGLAVRYVSTKDDPKLLSLETIQKVIT